MRKLCILLTDPMKVFYEKGEIKPGYYNPCNFFDEIHMVSFSNKDIAEDKVQVTAGKAKLKIHPIGKISIFSFPVLVRRISALIKAINPDMIRAYDPSLRGALAVYFGKKFNLPVIVSVHSHLDDQRKFDGRLILKIRKILEYYSLKGATKVICVSGHVKAYVSQYGSANAQVVYNRVDLKRFGPQSTMPLKSKNQKIILSVGRLDKEKYHECLIRAVSGLDMKLILIGQGRLEAYLRSLVKSLGLSQKVIFIKSVPHVKIHQFYQSAQIFAISTKFEGFCIPIAEAMAASLPIVASNIPPISEFIGDAGILVNNKPEEFRKAIKMVLDDDALKKSLGLKAKERSKIFDSDALERKECDVYRAALEGRLS